MAGAVDDVCHNDMVQWGYLLTQVIDNGHGIQPDVLRNLFTTFNQTKLSNLKSQGVGIGLQTSKVLAYSLQGGITLKSQPNRGTNVCFSVQCRDVSAKFFQNTLRNSTYKLRNELGDLEIVHHDINHLDDMLIPRQPIITLEESKRTSSINTVPN